MTSEERNLIQEPIFQYFHELCQTPRPSFHEKKISAYLLKWAKDRGLDAEQDSVNNIFIRKAAAPGYENAPCIMLQAHMDMVCEKAPDVEHDFETDPIQWKIEGDRMTTGGRTTLGADDGIGVAFAMAVLADDNLPHPELEVLFTTAEEEDLSGAERFDASKMKAARLINLDHACDREILCGSCGGQAVELRVPVVSTTVPEGWTSAVLSVAGLQGGHSGEDIHRGHGNANSLLARVLLAIEEKTAYKLGPVTGGSFRLAIPRDACAVICFPDDKKEVIKNVVQTEKKQMQRELSSTGENLHITFKETEMPLWCVEPDLILTTVLLAPDGIYQMNESLEGLVDTSDNMGEIYLTEKELRVIFEIRSARPSLGNYIYQRICRLAKITGGTCETSKGYPSWDFRPQSSLREIASQTYQELFGNEPRYLTVHAGLEVGFLSEKKPDLDAIAIGPDCWNFHSPTEEMSISSARKVYQFLCGILKNCR